MKKLNAPLSIFLVDDDKMFLKSLEHTLKEKFKSIVKIYSFSDGEECLKNMNKNPDIVILDYYLNSENADAMNGLQILSKIKSVSRNAVVVMLSAQDKIEIAVNSIKAGAYEYVAKSESAIVRMQSIVNNIIHNIRSMHENKTYETWNFVMAGLLILLILFDIVYYIAR